MQELLTGKRRLPGFQKSSGYKQTDVGLIPEDWSIKYISELGSFKKGRGIKKDEIISLGNPCIRYGEIYTKYNYIIKKINSFISEYTSKNSESIKKGDILFTGSGETAEEIGKCVVYLDDLTAYAGGDIIILTHTYDDPLFLGYSLNNNIINKQKAEKAQGDAVVHIYTKTLGEVKVPLPKDKNEQSTIAQVLSDMDAEIEALEQKKNKYIKIKNGMMNELLTGRIRLK